MKIMKAATVLAAAGTAVLALAVPANAATAASSQGCSSGDVCIYPGAGWNGGHPSSSYSSYGAHNLSNVLGSHRIYNYQTGGATVWACSGYNGTGKVLFGLYSPGWADENFTPVNSIVLSASSHIPTNC